MNQKKKNQLTPALALEAQYQLEVNAHRLTGCVSTRVGYFSDQYVLKPRLASVRLGMMARDAEQRGQMKMAALLFEAAAIRLVQRIRGEAMLRAAQGA